jgi:crotonobetainyl-CoA:carnitine CoA-transferase CaiB-like acyl-CoA transferase
MLDDSRHQGPLVGLRVVELASERACFAGKLLADHGAEVVVVEPPAGHHSRRWAPFAGDVEDPERSLWWWHYNTSKLGVRLDLDDAADAETFARLVATADIVLESEPPGTLAARGLDYPDLRARRPDMIWVSVTPFGRSGPRAGEQVTDLTVLSAGGPVWSCGYDDHSIPPVRGGGNQGFHTASIFAVMAALTAVLHRGVTGVGQFVDVSMHAAANVTTEAATYEYLVAQRTVQRMTGRHAGVRLTTSSIAPAADGTLVHSGVPPRSGPEFGQLLAWIDDLGLRDEFGEAFFLEMGRERGGVHISEIYSDPEAQAIFNAGREGVKFLAARLGAYDFFIGAQTHGLAATVVYSPEEVLSDPHFVARGFPTPVEHEDLGATYTYPGLPFGFGASPGRITRAPHLGEHDDVVLAPLRDR